LVVIIENKLGGKGRVLIRYSGTLNICRIMVEGPNLALIEQMTDEIANLIQKEIGVLDK
jgi:phosphoglucosamine mutase